MTLLKGQDKNAPQINGVSKNLCFPLILLGRRCSPVVERRVAEMWYPFAQTTIMCNCQDT